ncbi:MAG: dTDP-4-dehydrorhamnose 3,5-epimerase [Cytophagales bacterium]
MEFRTNHIQGLLEIIPDVWKDERGYFFESFHSVKWSEHGVPKFFLQDNQSFSIKGTLRGLHLQRDPFAQGKLVSVATGKALDVVVDVRPGSPTFGQHAKFVLDSEAHNMVYVPPGFAHGFLALEDVTFTYKCTGVYNKESESGLLWNDAELGIDWGLDSPLVSEKDKQLPTFSAFKKLINV